MIKKIYKYRPLSDFLFKELFYCEIYFATYPELNDPLDLTVDLDFRPKEVNQLEYLINSLVKISVFPPYEEDERGMDIDTYKRFFAFAKNFKLRTELCENLYNKYRTGVDFISLDQIIEDLKIMAEQYNTDFRYDLLKKEIVRLTNIFFRSSYITCFSETCTDFLMWSHYASKHQGVCLEFTLNKEGEFPYIISTKRNVDQKKYSEKHSVWDTENHICWDNIHKVEYKTGIPSLNYFDFAPVFENEHDCDLMGLSKSKWHRFAYELEKVFCHKTDAWKYEKEWRAIEINFGKIKQPEERIRHYPIEALTKIYFGIRTPHNVKERIFQIINNKNSQIEYYEAKLTDDRCLDFTMYNIGN